MLLVLDVGNTNTVLGVFARIEEPESDSGQARYGLLVANWRVATIATQTVDEYGVLFRNLFSMDKIEVKGVHGIVVSSVVPPLDSTLRQVCERYFNTKPLFIEPGVKTGMPVLYENPAEVGADRIVNAVAAFEKYGGPCVVVDFGTATTFDCVSSKGEYMGGVICPGIGILPGHRNFGGRAVRKHSALAASGYSQTHASDRYDYCRQPAIWALLWISRAGGWNSRAASRRDGRRNPSCCDRRLGRADRQGIQTYQAGGRFFDAGGPTHHLGAECEGGA